MGKQTSRGAQMGVGTRSRGSEKLFIYALGLSTLAYVILVRAGVIGKIDNETVAATSALCLALVASFAFITEDDPSFGILPELAKALAAGVLLPVAVVTSGADLTWGAVVVIGIVLMVISAALIGFKAGWLRAPGALESGEAEQQDGGASDPRDEQG